MNDACPTFRFAVQPFISAVFAEATPRQQLAAGETCSEARAEIHGTARDEQYAKEGEPIGDVLRCRCNAARDSNRQISTERSVPISGRVVAAPQLTSGGVHVSLHFVRRVSRAVTRGAGVGVRLLGARTYSSYTDGFQVLDGSDPTDSPVRARC